MIEMYGFIAAFTAQILFFSVLGALRVTGSLHAQIAQFIAERAPPVDPAAAARVEQRLRLYRRLGLWTAVVGLLLLVPMIRYMLRPDWHDGPLEVVVPAYFMLQVLPTFLAVVTALKFHETLKRSLPQVKRKALLQPRGLFDFVSPLGVALSLLAYLMHLALLAYIERHPFPGFAGLVTNGAIVTAMYVAMATGIFVTLRMMASSPLQGREDRMRAVGMAVKACVYSSIVGVIFISLNMGLILVDEQRWEPTFASIGLIALGLLSRMAMREQTRISGTDGSVTAALTR